MPPAPTLLPQPVLPTSGTGLLRLKKHDMFLLAEEAASGRIRLPRATFIVPAMACKTPVRYRLYKQSSHFKSTISRLLIPAFRTSHPHCRWALLIMTMTYYIYIPTESSRTLCRETFPTFNPAILLPLPTGRLFPAPCKTYVCWLIVRHELQGSARKIRLLP